MFNFITSDLVSKLNILRCYRKGGAADYYVTVQSMLQYEKEQPSLTQPSASRTLLRLHRALQFVCGFLREMITVSMDAKLGPVAKPVYAETLAKFHPWLISKTVGAVLLLLPDKKVMITRLFGESEASQLKSLEKFPDLVKVLEKIYDATQKFYSDYDMLNLP
ncbi:Glycolipid transfer protein domain [Trinorchestia longiramus]|nr:Glycolipid transfer protein domain [Trinorchestia longiramus]